MQKPPKGSYARWIAPPLLLRLSSLRASTLRKVHCRNSCSNPSDPKCSLLVGPRVLHQVPEGSIVPSSRLNAHLPEPLLDFTSISSYLIPTREFCDRLVTVRVHHHRVIGYPICIDDPTRYDRNQYIFNLAMVLDEAADISAHASVAKKLARMLRNLEEQNLFLSSEEDVGLWDRLEDDEHGVPDAKMRGSVDGAAPEDVEGDEVLAWGRGQKIYALCEMILEDLNNYCECMIPIDEANTINLKLFPTRPPPAPVRAWHVPLLTIQSSTLGPSASSDLTLTRILPYIDGIRSVAQIARLADTDLSLARKAIAHLLYYGCILLLDIFQFSAVYAPTAEIAQFVEDTDAQDEAIGYVSVGQYREISVADTSGDQNLSASPARSILRRAKLSGTKLSDGSELATSAPKDTLANPSSNPSSNPDITISGTPKPSPSSRWEWHTQSTSLSRASILQLYTSLKPGLPLRQWCLDHETLLGGVDIRRFITFGVIKGFLYRVQRYAYANIANGATTAEGDVGGTAEKIARWDAQIKHGNGVSQYRPEMIGTPSVAAAEVNRRNLAAKDLPLARYLDGLHCFDKICTELQMSEKEVVKKMRDAYGDVYVISR